MWKLQKLIHSFFYIIFIQVRKYNNETRSKDIVIFILSIYLLIISLIMLLITEKYINRSIININININKMVYLLISISSISYLVSFLYFTYKEKYREICKEFSNKSINIQKENRIFLVFNITLIFIFLIVSFVL